MSNAHFWHIVVKEDGGRSELKCFNNILDKWIQVFCFSSITNGRNPDKEDELKQCAHAASQMKNVIVVMTSPPYIHIHQNIRVGSGRVYTFIL